MTPDEHHAFVNALRECLGLGPLYNRMKIEGKEDPLHPDRYTNFSHHIGDGNRRVKWSSDYQIKRSIADELRPEKGADHR